MRCIICRSNGSFISEEHIIPESFGQTDWAVLDIGIVCDKCNQYFSTNIEKDALESFPFKVLRSLLGIPTKKGKPSLFETPDGLFWGRFATGRIIFQPVTEELDRDIKNGKTKRITLTIPEVPERPTEICRLLVKMGLEWIAKHDRALVETSEFDEARAFCRKPNRGMTWSFAMSVDHEIVSKHIKRGLKDLESRIFELDYFKAEVWFFGISFLGIEMFVPMEKLLAGHVARESRFRIYNVVI